MKDKANRSFKYVALRFNNTRFAQNMDSLLRFKKIYYHLMENEMPIMKGGERKKKAKRAEQAKNAILLSFMAFFFMYNRIGIVNRMMFCLVSTQGLIFLTKSNFYKQCVEELNYEMTLSGQESRILTQYYFELHPQK